MRYSSRDEESNLWVALSFLWYLASLTAWSTAVFGLSSSPVVDSGSLTLLGVGFFGISLAMRLPILSSPPQASDFTNHVVCLLGFAANLNWLGCITLRMEPLVDALPAVVILLATEVWILWRALAADRLRWLHSIVTAWQKQLATLVSSESFVNHDAPKTEPPLRSDAFSSAHACAGELQTWTTVPLPPPPSADAEAAEEVFLRRSLEGLDESGGHFQSGQVKVAMESEQTTETVVIAFCPVFDDIPDVELECESIDVTSVPCVSSAIDEPAEYRSPAEVEPFSAELVNCTPLGMRVAFRRPPRGADQACWLHWYATLPMVVKSPPRHDSRFP